LNTASNFSLSWTAFVGVLAFSLLPRKDKINQIRQEKIKNMYVKSKLDLEALIELEI